MRNSAVLESHILAVDGYSRKIVGVITIPHKNAISTYGSLMKPLLLSEGMCEQVRVDHGSEFALLVAMHATTPGCFLTKSKPISSLANYIHK